MNLERRELKTDKDLTSQDYISVWLAAVSNNRPTNAEDFWKNFDGYEARRVRPVTCWGRKPWGNPNPEDPNEEGAGKTKFLLLTHYFVLA